MFLWERLPATSAGQASRGGWAGAGKSALQRRIVAPSESGEGGMACRAGWWWKAWGAFLWAQEGRGSRCALRRRPPCLRCRPGLCGRGFQPRRAPRDRRGAGPAKAGQAGERPLFQVRDRPAAVWAATLRPHGRRRRGRRRRGRCPEGRKDARIVPPAGRWRETGCSGFPCVRGGALPEDCRG